jgi:Major Facilitator Superfamily
MGEVPAVQSLVKIHRGVAPNFFYGPAPHSTGAAPCEIPNPSSSAAEPGNGCLGAINNILVPQFMVVAIAPWIGVRAQSWGRRPLLLLTFVALSARGAIFAVTSDPYLLVAAQLLDGISAASLGVLVPLIIADVTRGSGHFNFAQGLIGAAVGIGASLSTTLAGFIADASGAPITFLLLACVGVMGLVFVFAVVPETRGASS